MELVEAFQLFKAINYFVSSLPKKRSTQVKKRTSRKARLKSEIVFWSRMKKTSEFSKLFGTFTHQLN